MVDQARKYKGPPGFQCRGASARQRVSRNRLHQEDLDWVAEHGTVPARWADRADAAGVLEMLKAQVVERARIHAAANALPDSEA